MASMTQFLRRQWFLTCLAGVLVLGFCWPGVFEPFANATWLSNVIVASVLFVMALPLETRSVGNSLRRPWIPLLASAVNMGLLPLVAWAASRLLSGDLRIGLLVAAAAPCTLASAAVWTQRAGGDDTVAILVTILTNVTCFLTTPFWLVITTGNEISGELSERLSQMPVRLALLVVFPMALAQLLRQHRFVGEVAARRRTELAVFAQLGILSMVLAGATQCGLRLSGISWRESVGARDLALMLLVVLALHVIVLWLGMLLARGCGISRPGQIAVGIAGSQKTLMVGLHVAITYFGGLTVLPMVAYHVGQLLADTIIADRLRKAGEEVEQLK